MKKNTEPIKHATVHEWAIEHGVIRSMEITQKKVIEWAEEKGIFAKGNSKSQSIKLLEEVSELLTEIEKGNLSNAKMELGDVLVVCTLLAKMMGTDTEDCLRQAYNKISKRTGKMVNGTFVKDK